jgi:hypothetical protein
MDQEIKSKWMAALRSGKYRQGYNRLIYCNYFCCLGVLADIVDPTASKVPTRLDKLKHRKEEILRPGRAGIKVSVQRKLAEMNDSAVPFSGIADYIEQHL